MSDLGDTPYDRGYVNGYNHGKSEAEDVAQAMVAAAYEAAAQTAFDHTPTKHGGAPLVAHVTGATIEREIRTLTPADARDALDRRDRQMRAEGAKAAEARIERLVENLISAAASLAAAISLLERSGMAVKKAAPSNRMFDQMLIDYRATLESARAALQENGYEC